MMGRTALSVAGGDAVRSVVTAGGYRPIYRAGTHCPGCDRTNWLVGRLSAECGYCSTVLPLAPERRLGR